MADDAIELDYDELLEEKEEKREEELPERYKKRNEQSPEARKRSPEARVQQKNKSPPPRRSIFSSGRISRPSRTVVPDNGDYSKHNDRYAVYENRPETPERDEEPEEEDSDVERGVSFKGVTTAARSTVAFPKFPVDRELVKEDLGVTKKHLRNAIIVLGTEKMNEYSILKVFAKYKPSQLDPINAKSYIIQFEDKKSALKMMMDMSKTLTTNESRFVEHTKIHLEFAEEEREAEPMEEGEVSSDEEGELLETGTVTNSVYKIGYPDIRETQHVVYINMRKCYVPEEKWRVVTSHVPQGRALLVRFATREELQNAKGRSMSIVLPKKNVDESGLEYSWTGEKVRAGLNIFDKEGNELEWDFEHDTRFYEGGKDKTEPVAKEWEAPALQVGIKGATKVRGRGAKRFLGDHSDTLIADGDASLQKKQRTTRNDDEKDWKTIAPSAKPTSHKW